MNAQDVKTGLNDQRCLIQRHLGHKNVMPGSSQWRVYTRQKDDCWICGRYILTVFIWTQRVGQLAAERDPKVINHYKEQLRTIKETCPMQ